MRPARQPLVFCAGHGVIGHQALPVAGGAPQGLPAPALPCIKGKSRRQTTTAITATSNAAAEATVFQAPFRHAPRHTPPSPASCQATCQVFGRPLLAAFCWLLCADYYFGLIRLLRKVWLPGQHMRQQPCQSCQRRARQADVLQTKPGFCIMTKQRATANAHVEQRRIHGGCHIGSI